MKMMQSKTGNRKSFNWKTLATTFFFSFLLFSLLLFQACKDKVEDIAIDYERDYFPVDSGRYTIYDVDSIVYTSIQLQGNTFQQRVDTIRFQLKELHAGAFYDSFQGNLKYRIEYFKRKSSDDPWQNDRVWYAILTSTNAQRQEDDLRFIKLIFPPREGLSWNGTLFIPKTGLYEFLSDWSFRYREVGLPKTIQGKNFDKTLIVEHVNSGEDNLLEYQYSREMYAKGVGMIYKDWDKISKQDVLSSWTNPQRANGFRLRMRVSSYGI